MTPATYAAGKAHAFYGCSALRTTHDASTCLWQVLRTPEDLPGLATRLHERLSRVVESSVSRLDAAYAALAGAAAYGGDASAQERHLRGAIEDYFGQEHSGPGDGGGSDPAPAQGASDGSAAAAASVEAGRAVASFAAAGGLVCGSRFDAEEDADLPWGGRSPVQRPPLEQLQRMVRGFLRAEAARLRDVGQERVSGLVVARLLAGLASPAFPADTWRKVTEWGRLQAVDFKRLIAAANAELPAMWQD